MALNKRVVIVAFVSVSACSKDDSARVERPDPVAPADGGMSEPDGGAVVRRCTQFNPLREPFFGDLHVHTALSLDANLQGTRLRPVDAYRFARGERVGLPPYDDAGQPRRTLALTRPLDFVALSDHAEFLGLVTTCLDDTFPGYDSPACDAYRNRPDSAFLSLNAWVAAPQGAARPSAPCDESNAYCGDAARSAWNEVRRAAREHHDASERCTFTTFVAYEWSASPGLFNLHRNVIFANDTVPELPFSYLDGNQEEELWEALERDCTGKNNGCDVLTIPHNSNLSGGLMFEPVNRDGKPIDAAYAKKRAAFEPLVEIFQHKGASECLPEMGNDEACAFELLPYSSLTGATFGTNPETLYPRDFLRHTLGEGLRLEQMLGVNPFAYGFVAGTDTHLGVPGAVSEEDFAGHGGAGSHARTVLPKGLADHHWLNPGGLAVLWAEENSRDALFAAMKRREAYGTSGPRIVLRFFGGFDYASDLCDASDFVAQGYAGGVPMGGELEPTVDRAPRFIVWAMRDPGTEEEPGVGLARVQIIKGWVEGGEVRYAVHDVAVHDGEPGSVDAATCEPRGEGAAELCAVWEDPDYQADQPAFYYARVLENPTCRWHARRCRAAGVTCENGAPIPEGFEGCCAGQPETHQERAWSSPIFVHGRRE